MAPQLAQQFELPQLDGEKVQRPTVAPIETITVPAGKYHIGTNDPLYRENPSRTATVSKFEIMTTEVTVGQVAQFLRGKETAAERDGTGLSYDFKKKDFVVLDGACWWNPQGEKIPDGMSKAEFKNQQIAKYADHPATYLNMAETEMCLKQMGMRLPTAVEWEVAATRQSPTSRSTPTYAWGNASKFAPGQYPGNYNQGVNGDKNGDGFLFTNPVKYFKPINGLYGMTGNVWERTSTRVKNSNECQIKGGSWRCGTKATDCHGILLSGYQPAAAESTSHVLGFRGVKIQN